MDNHTSVTEALAAHWSTLSFEDIPDDVVRKAKDNILDTLAVAMAGVRTEESSRVRKALLSVSPHGGLSRIWGTDRTLGPAHAALANGTSAHARDFDDGGGPGHAGSTTLPAAIAAAEVARSSGRDLIAATVAGYDVSFRLLQGCGGFGHQTDRGWHTTGTFGTFAAAAAAAKIFGLDERRFADALGIAGSFTGGIWAFIDDGAWTKRLHPGKAGESGIDAALMARDGVTGPHRVFESKWGGIFATYNGGEGHPERVLANLGSEFNVANAYLKPYACCRGSHGVIDALLKVILERDLRPADIRAITVIAGETAYNMLNVDPIDTVFDAQFSLPYAISVAIDSRSVGLAQFDPPRVGEPAIQELLAKVAMVRDASIDLLDGPRLIIELADGTSLTLETGDPTDAKGSEKNPMTHTEVVAKATELLLPYGADATHALVEAVEQLDHADDIDALIAALGATVKED